MANPRILIAAGGTGGHVYPAIAIADAITEQERETEILFVGTKNHMEWRVVPQTGYRIVNVWISGFHRRFTLRNLLFPVKLLVSIVQSYRIISAFKPHVMVSCGGYVAGPVGWVAAKRGIEVMIQEQNSFPGVTNRILARYASRIFTAFKGAERYLPVAKIRLTGNPTRKSLNKLNKQEGLKAFGFEAHKPVLMIMGGSGGARSINEAVMANLDALKNLQIIWQCGSRYYKEYSTAIDLEKYPNLRLVDYIDQMPEAYAAADLVVTRAGAGSCSELMITGKPSVLIPSPNVAGDHQTRNAQSMVEAGASEMITDDTAKDTLADLVIALIRNEEKLKKMNQAALSMAKPNAASEIAEEILTLAKSRLN